jgi:hypothetical protein
MADAGERSSLGRLTQGYGPLLAVLIGLVMAIVLLPMLNAVADAPAVVTEADIERLQSLPAVPGSAESAYPAFQRTGRRSGGSPCTRDHALYGLAQFLHLPRSQLRRFEYSVITDCRLRLS